MWTGRIGFIREGEFTTVGWDDADQDFEIGRAPGGVIVPFAINTSTGVVAFQRRAGVVRPTTLAGAFRGLLNVIRRDQWIVAPLTVVLSFSDWQGDVVRVTPARFRLQQPNPEFAPPQGDRPSPASWRQRSRSSKPGRRRAKLEHQQPPLPGKRGPDAETLAPVLLSYLRERNIGALGHAGDSKGMFADFASWTPTGSGRGRPGAGAIFVSWMKAIG